jgi:hypothetical protein
MASQVPSFPYFESTAPRALTAQEQAVLMRLVQGLPWQFAQQVDGLRVVGRCGCGACPTVFFLPHEQGEEETDLVAMAGKDNSGGLVAAVLFEKSGLLSQLEFYSVDGHEPWEVPNAENLAPW